MKLRVRPVAVPSRDLHEFLELPYRLHRRLEHWVPPLRRDAEFLLDRGRNPFFEHGNVQCFLAERVTGAGARVVGRVAAIENHAHNAFHQDRVGFFGFFDCEEDPEAAAALFDAAAEWLGGRGFEVLRGPVTLSTNDEAGLLVRGFHRPPAVLMPYHPPYYARLVEDAGFAKAKDLFAFYYDGPLPEVLARAAERVARRNRAVTRSLDRSRYLAEVDGIRELYNAAWQRNWGFVPMTKHEIDHMAKELKAVLVPDLVRIAEVRGEPVAFALALPDLNQVLIHLKGRMGPWGTLKFLWLRRRVNCLRVLTLGIREGYRASGIDVLLYHDLFREGFARGITAGEFSWVLEDNVAMARPLERIGATVDRVYRIYDRAIARAGGA